MDSRFSSNPEDSPDAIKTPLGWMLRGPQLQKDGDSDIYNFLLTGLHLSQQIQNMENSYITDEGEVFPVGSSTDELLDTDEFLQSLSAHKEIQEFGLKVFKGKHTCLRENVPSSNYSGRTLSITFALER